MKNKKAISLMVSYTLLIVIAIALSVIVYGYLKIYLPGQQRECPANINLALEDVVCSNSNLDITISNRGLFNVSGAFVRVGDKDRTVRTQVNPGDEFFPPISPNSPLINLPDFTIPPNTLTPGEEHVIEIQPVVLVDQQFLVPCKNAVVTYPLTCT